MKAHIVLDDNIRHDPEAKQLFLDRLVGMHSIQNLDLARYKRHGILSGDFSVDCLDELQNLPGIKSVERDEAKQIIS